MPLALLILVSLFSITLLPELTFAADTGSAYSVKQTTIPSVSCSVTVIGDSVTLGAKYFGNLAGRIAKVKNVSWCKVDALGSRGLVIGAKPTGVELAKTLKKNGKLGRIVVYALATNHSYSYDEVKKAVDLVGKDRYVILVTGYVKGHPYTLRSRKAAKKIAKERDNVFIADWYSVMKSKGGKGLSDNYCHLTQTSAKWYGGVIIKSVKAITKITAKKKANKIKSLKKNAALDKFGTISLVVGRSAKSPVGLYGRNASDVALTWSSSNEAVVAVDAKGKLTAVSAGTAHITVTNPAGKSNKTSFTVKVVASTVHATGITLSAKKLSAKALKIKVVASNAGVTGAPTYTSANTKIATVSRSGVVTGKKAGKVKVTVKYGGIKKTVKVTVNKQN
jgi:hypothetical protein